MADEGESDPADFWLLVLIVGIWLPCGLPHGMLFMASFGPVNGLFGLLLGPIGLVAMLAILLR